MKRVTVWEGEYLISFPYAKKENFVLTLFQTSQQKVSGTATNLLFVGEATHVIISPQGDQEINLYLKGFSTEPIDFDLAGALGYVRMPHIKINLSFTQQGELKRAMYALRNFRTRLWEESLEACIDKMIFIK